MTNRAPMQWSDKRFAGFTTGNATWIEVSDDYHSVNVEVGWVVVFLSLIEYVQNEPGLPHMYISGLKFRG